MPKSISARIEAKIEIDEETGCHLWSGALNGSGYPQIRIGKRGSVLRLVRRVVWRIEMESDVPANYRLRSECRNKLCVNVRHLRLGRSGDWGYKSKTHCVRGHELSEENTRTYKDGWRRCKTCHRDRARNWWRERHGKGGERK